jgi:uncharacterized membrane protein
MSETESAAPRPSESPRRWSSLKARMRNRLMAGLILVLPIWITLLLAAFVFRLMRDASLWIVEALLISPWIGALLERAGLSAEIVRTRGLEGLPTAVQWALAAVSVLLTVAVIYVLGIVTTNIVGRRIVHWIEAIVDRLPFVKTVYRASKQVLETFAGESAQSFQRVVLVPFPSPDARTIGFITRVHRDPATGDELCAVFVATAPNPTTGFVLVVKRRDLVELDWSVEEAVRVVMSGGVLLPELRMLAGRATTTWQNRPRDTAAP